MERPPCARRATASHSSGVEGRSADQTGQVGKNQDNRRGEKDDSSLAVLRLFEHGRMPFVVMGGVGAAVLPGRPLRHAWAWF